MYYGIVQVKKNCFFELYLKKVGGKLLFHCNFDLTKLSITLPDFHKEIAF